jgi:hypothetical protein
MPQKKSYSVHWENEEAVSFEVDGVTYTNLNDIPDKRDKDKLQQMMANSSQPEFDEKEWEATQKESNTAFNIILWVFGGVAALMLLIAVLSGGSALTKLSHEESASGVVVEMVIRPAYDQNDRDRLINEFHYPVVRFAARDGRVREVQMVAGSDPPSYEVGDEVTVRYDPEKPLDARIDSFGSNVLLWILPGITGVLGLAFAGAVFVVQKLNF